MEYYELLLHPDSKQILEYLSKRNSFRYLYHFTDVDNLPFVARFDGLRGKEYLEEVGVLPQIKTGGNELSKDLELHFGNWDKVSLSFCPRLPMAYWREQEQHLCYVVVKPTVVALQGVIFTDRNATDKYQARSPGLDGLKQVDLGAVKHEHPYPNQEIKKKKQAEILVPDWVGLSDIEHIAFRSESSRQYANYICGSHADFCKLFTVDSSLFIAPASYTQEHWLTSQRVTSENVKTLELHTALQFNRRQEVTAVMLVEAKAGSQELFQWRTSSGSVLQEYASNFEKSWTYWTWETLEIRDLEPGYYFVEYVLDRIPQLTLQFAVSDQ